MSVNLTKPVTIQRVASNHVKLWILGYWEGDNHRVRSFATWDEISAFVTKLLDEKN